MGINVKVQKSPKPRDIPICTGLFNFIYFRAKHENVLSEYFGSFKPKTKASILNKGYIEKMRCYHAGKKPIPNKFDTKI